MPYAYRKSFKRRGVRRSKFRARRGYRMFNRKVKSVVRRMAEVKYSFDAAPVPINKSTWAVTDITPLMVQGPDKDDRIGASIRFKNWTFKFIVASGPVDPEEINHYPIARVRVIIATCRIDPESITATQNLDDSSNILTTFKPAGINVIYDKIIHVGALESFSDTGIPASKCYKFHKRLTRNAKFMTTSSAITQTPQARLVMLTSQDAGDFELNLYYWSKISFIDI